MDKLDNYLAEIQSDSKLYLPHGKDLEEVSFDGKTVYTSPALKENIKTSVQKNLSKQQALIIVRMIERGILIPVFLSKGVIDYLRKRSKIKTHNLGTAVDGKAFIFVDTIYQRFKLTSVDEKKLARLILHELMHISHRLNMKGFLKVNHNLIIQFWKAFFINYLELTGSVPNRGFDHIVDYQTKIEVRGTWNSDDLYTPVFNSLEKYSSLDEKIIQERYDVLQDFITESLKEFSKRIPYHIANAKDYAYKKIAGNKSETFGQELWNFGEIISILAELKPNHSNVTATLRILL